MPVFTMSVDCEFEVYCDQCGAGLCGNSREEVKYGRLKLYVSPCEKCLAAEREEGRDEGSKESAQ